MVLKTELGEYAIHFRHHKASVMNPHWETVASVHPAPCLTEERPCGSECHTGVAHCNPTDQFNRALGRKLALTRALRPLDKIVRTVIWKAYFNRNKGGADAS